MAAGRPRIIARRAFAVFGALALALAAAGGVRAVEPAPPSQADKPTTVQGVTVAPPPSPEEKFARALTFVQSHGAPGRIGQLARWTERVCPLTLGLSPGLNDFVSGRVRLLATRAGAPVQKARRCRPNIEILFVAQPQLLMDAVARRRSELLGFHYVASTRRLATVTRSVEARYLTSTQGGAGDAAPDIAAGKPMDAGGTITGPVSLANAGTMPGGCAGSRLTACLSSLFSNVLVVVDAPAMERRPIGPIADYIAMLALSQARSLDACDALPSILDQFSVGCAGRRAPATWTEGDIAYLKALYSIDLTVTMALEKAKIAGRMSEPDRRPPLGSPPSPP
jgi:hypothetical protein